MPNVVLYIVHKNCFLSSNVISLRKFDFQQQVKWEMCVFDNRRSRNKKKSFTPMSFIIFTELKQKIQCLFFICIIRIQYQKLFFKVYMAWINYFFKLGTKNKFWRALSPCCWICSPFFSIEIHSMCCLFQNIVDIIMPHELKTVPVRSSDLLPAYGQL